MPHYYQTSHLRKGAEKHVFIAVPTYGEVKAGFMSSVVAAISDLFARKVSVELAILTGNCHVDDARNDLCRMFLESPCTHLMFIDADLQFNATAIGALLEYEKDFVAGVYPYKNDEVGYPVFAEGAAIAELVEAKAVPGGFMCIKREIIEKLYEQEFEKGAWPNKGTYGTLPVVEIFHRTIEEGRSRRSGDYEFCAKARELGYKIFVAPHLNFGHVGDKIWIGNVRDFWLKQAGQLEKIAADALNKGDFKVFSHAFGNQPYAADWHLLETLDREVRALGKPSALETGSGGSTLVMQAAGAKVRALESEPMWGQYTARYLEAAGQSTDCLVYAPIVDGPKGRWYGSQERHDSPFDLIFIDGPRREEAGMRARICDYMPDALRAAKVLVVDDTDDADGRAFLARLNKEFGFSFDTFKGPRREYAVGRIERAEMAA